MKKGIIVTKKWYDLLDQDDVSLLYQLADADFKLSKLSNMTGMSYFVLKKRIDKLKTDLLSQTNGDADFKGYLDFLVEQKILPSSIAQVLYEKHLDGMNR